MDSVFVGKIVNTHGIKGEIRIKSDFEFKDKVFVVGNEVIIKEKKYIIESYRVHKEYDMITLKGFNDINDVIPFKGYSLFVDRSILNLGNDDYLLEDLIGMNIIIDDKLYGEVLEYTTGINPLLVVSYNRKKYYIPLKGDFITNVDIKNGYIYVSDYTKELIIWK